MNDNPQVLIVDDDETMRHVVESLLLKEGYELSFASSGQKALDTLEVIAPDVILLDIMMPDIDGLEVCRRIKSDKRWQHIPVILLTALNGRENLVRGLDAGADEFLSKPVAGSELRARVRSMLRIKSQYDTLNQQRKELDDALHLTQKLADNLSLRFDELELLHEVALQLMSDLDTDSVLSLLAKTSVQLVPKTGQCMVHFISEEDQQVLSVAVSPDNGSKIAYSNIGIEETVAQATEAGKTIYIPDLSSMPNRLQGEFAGVQALLMTPLPSEHAPLAALSIHSCEANAFEKEHRHIWPILANQAAVAILKAQYFEERDIIRQREREAVRSLFERYISPSVVDQMLSDEENVALGGNRCEISVLFADIPGFTALSENLEPEKLINALNRYLGLAVEIVVAEEGTVDKFIGDAVMAFFNAPLSQPDHVLRAIRTALAIQQATVEYNQHSTEEHALHFNIGIHTGPAIVGNVGTNQRMNYTAIGDTVNLAKRLQENASDGQIILSHNAYQVVKDVIVVEDLGTLLVKGRVTPEHVYSLISLAA